MPLLSAPRRWHLDPHTPPPPSATPSCHAGPTPSLSISTVIKEIIASSRSGPTAVSGGACATRREQQPPSSWFFSRSSGIPLRPACRALQWAALSSQLRTRCAGTPSGYDTKPGNKYCYTGVCNASTKICDPVPPDGPCNSEDQCTSGSFCVGDTCQVRGGAQAPSHAADTAQAPSRAADSALAPGAVPCLRKDRCGPRGPRPHADGALPDFSSSLGNSAPEPGLWEARLSRTELPVHTWFCARRRSRRREPC